MRFKYFLKATFAVVLIAYCGQSAIAQNPDVGMMSQGMPYPGEYAPVPGSGYGELPSSYSSWPETSPYARSYEQYQNNDGQWNANTNNRTQRYTFKVDYLTGRTRIPNSFIGNPNAETYIQTISSTLNTGQGGGGGGGGQQNQNSPLTLFGGTSSFATTMLGIPQQPHWELFGALSLGSLGRIDTDGTRFTFGIDNSDDSSLRFGFLYNGNNNFVYDARQAQLHRGRGGQPGLTEEILRSPDFDQIDLSPLSSADLILQNNLFILHGIPLDDGTLIIGPDGTSRGGVTAPYDLDFRVTLKSQMYAGNAEWALSPVVDWKFLRIRPTVGARYFFLRESFGFYGRDSGLAYGGTTQGGGGGGGNQNLSPDVKISSPPDGIDQDSDGIVDNAGVIEGGGGQGGGGGQNPQGQSNFVQVHFPDRFRYPITSFLNNDSDSHLGGAEVGLTYDLGGDSLMITGSSKVGLYANHETINMNGDNIAMHTRDNTLLLPSTDNARPNAFNDKVTHTHVSPLFEQSFTAEAAIFRYIPVLRRVSLLEKAQFRAGYSFMYIGKVLQPSSSINWQGNPADTTFNTKGRPGLFPTIHADYGTYLNQSYNFGVSWSY